MNRTFALRSWVLLLALVVWAAGSPAHAADSVERLGERLRSSSDFRVRTQAALALGASKSSGAIKPLCTALEDPNTTVRAAAAAALGKLMLGGKECLSARLDDEENASVKSVIEKAIARIDGGVLPTITDSTEYYVAIAETVDKTGRQAGDVDRIVRAVLLSSATNADGFVVAPPGETVPQAKAVLSKHRGLKAFYLWPKVSPPDYSGGNLTIRLEISIFTYPGKALKGTVPLKLTMQDVSRGDADSEDELIRMAASKAFEKFLQNKSRME